MKNAMRDFIGLCQDAAESCVAAFKEALRELKRQRWLRQRRKALVTPFD